MKLNVTPRELLPLIFSFMAVALGQEEPIARQDEPAGDSGALARQLANPIGRIYSVPVGTPGNPEPEFGSRRFGLGDVSHSMFLSPGNSGMLIWGAGPILSILTATSSQLVQQYFIGYGFQAFYNIEKPSGGPDSALQFTLQFVFPRKR
jgi:hypothetical protein